MYDWPQIRSQTDRFWAAIARRLRGDGLAVPDTLSRNEAPETMWLSPGLVLGQTCGLPYIRGLRGRVALVGVPEYQVPDCKPGWYNSVIIVRSADTREKLSDFRHSPLAINGADSQSGCQAILFAVAQMTENDRFFGTILTSGSHAQTINMVAGGNADIGAIDHVSWRLARNFLAKAARLRVLDHTSPTPGLPLITANIDERDAIARAVAGATGDLTAEENALNIQGLWACRPQDYDLIAERARVGDRILRAHDIQHLTAKDSVKRTKTRRRS